MGMRIRRPSLRWVWLGVAAGLLATAVDGWQLMRLQRWNARIADGTAPGDTPRPELQFARAYAQAAAGDTDAALKQYQALRSDPQVGAAARYNGANLLMRQAIAVRAGAQPGQAIALLELAKQGYRELLRQDPQQWDARYNLERAQRLLPDPEAADEEAPTEPPGRERAATTMRGESLGLP
jgi:mxaK protein